MFQFIGKGMSGGISYIANGYGKANNKCVKNYDSSKPLKYIMYLYANNLYGCTMSLFTNWWFQMDESEKNRKD